MVADRKETRRMKKYHRFFILMPLDKLIVIKKYRLRSYINIVINYSTNKNP